MGRIQKKKLNLDFARVAALTALSLLTVHESRAGDLTKANYDAQCSRKNPKWDRDCLYTETDKNYITYFSFFRDKTTKKYFECYSKQQIDTGETFGYYSVGEVGELTITKNYSACSVRLGIKAASSGNKVASGKQDDKAAGGANKASPAENAVNVATAVNSGKKTKDSETPYAYSEAPKEAVGSSGGQGALDMNDPARKAAIEKYAEKNGEAVTKNGFAGVRVDENGQRYWSEGGKKYTLDGKPIFSEGSNDFYTANGKTYDADHRADWVEARGDGNGVATYFDKDGHKTEVTYKDGAPVKKTIDGKDVTKETLAKAKEKKNKAIPDDCAASVAIDPTYSCNGTNKIAHFSEVGNQVMQTAGATIVGMIGNQTAQNAQKGTASSTQKGVAKAAKTAFTYEAILTAANVATAAKLGSNMQKHEQNRAGIEEKRAQAEAMDPNADLSKFEAAKLEQIDAKKTAENGAFAATMFAVRNATNAAAAKKLQKDAEKAARQYKELETMTATQGVAYEQAQAVIGLGPDATQSAATDGTESTSSQDANGTGSEAPTNLLGNGTDLNGDKSGVESLAPGSFKAAAAGPGGGGSGGGATGGGGGGGGGGASPSEESKASYASEFGTKEKYESGGGIGGAKPAGGAGAKDGGGIDLNNLLAQFLPKSEEDVGSKNGILDYAGGGKRGIASDEAPSYLDKNADLFQRIHDTMSEKNRKGHVGL